MHGQMEYMIESNVSIDDEILQKELSSTSDQKVKNIVATIQKEQNKIIRNEDAIGYDICWKENKVFKIAKNRKRSMNDRKKRNK